MAVSTVVCMLVGALGTIRVRGRGMEGEGGGGRRDGLEESEREGWKEREG